MVGVRAQRWSGRTRRPTYRTSWLRGTETSNRAGNLVGGGRGARIEDQFFLTG